MWPFTRSTRAPEGTPPLVALASDDPWVWQAARTSLVAAGDASALRAAAVDPNPAVRARALPGLVEVCPDEREALLRDALEDPDAGVRCEALRRGGVARLTARSPEAVTSWGRLGASGEAALQAVLGDPGLAAAALDAVAMRPDGVGPALAAAVRPFASATDPDLRARAVRALGAAESEVLVAALRDPVPAVQQAAASTLGRRGVRSAIPPLASALAGGAWWAAHALAELGGPEVLPPLRAALRDRRTAAVAAAALGALGDTASIPELRALVARLEPEPQPQGGPDDLGVAQAALERLLRGG